MSTASCAPPHNGSPLAITSILLSSCRAMCSKLRSLSRVLVVTLAPASRQTLAAARSKGTPRPRKTPAWAHAARWSPNGSRMRRHRQTRADRGNGRRRRLRSMQVIIGPYFLTAAIEVASCSIDMFSRSGW